MLLWLLACAPDLPAEAPDRAHVRLSGTVHDGEGTVADLTLQACAAAVCVAGFTDRNGSFRMRLEPGRWSLKVVPDEAGRAPVVLPLVVDEDRDIALELPRLADPVPLPDVEAEVLVAPGVTLVASAASLGADAVAAAPIGADTPLDDIDGDPVAGWWLSPSGAGTDVPFALEVAGEAWCTSVEGDRWERCDGVLPALGGLLVTE